MSKADDGSEFETFEGTMTELMKKLGITLSDEQHENLVDELWGMFLVTYRAGYDDGQSDATLGQAMKEGD